MFQTKICRASHNTYCMFSKSPPIPPPHQKSCPLRDNVEKCGTAGQATDGSTIRRMRFACWVTKATDAQSEHDNSGYAKAPECYVMRTFAVLLRVILQAALLDLSDWHSWWGMLCDVRCRACGTHSGIQVSTDVTLCCWGGGGGWFLSCLRQAWPLFFETMCTTHQTTWHHVPEGSILVFVYTSRSTPFYIWGPFGLTVFLVKGPRWRSWLRHCATNRQVAGSIPDGVSGFLIGIILSVALWPWVRLSL
jgi:hypothetical protein